MIPTQMLCRQNSLRLNTWECSSLKISNTLEVRATVAHTLLAAAGATATGFPGQDLRDLVTTPDPAPRFLLAAHEMSAG